MRRRAEVTAQANSVWQEARANNCFAAFAPYLGELIALSREIADLLGWQGERYDALLDLYEPGLTMAVIETFFADLRAHVVPLFQQIAASPVKGDGTLLRNAEFPIADKELVERATGHPPSAADYVAYLTRKYSQICRV